MIGRDSQFSFWRFWAKKVQESKGILHNSHVSKAYCFQKEARHGDFWNKEGDAAPPPPAGAAVRRAPDGGRGGGGVRGVRRSEPADALPEQRPGPAGGDAVHRGAGAQRAGLRLRAAAPGPEPGPAGVGGHGRGLRPHAEGGAVFPGGAEPGQGGSGHIRSHRRCGGVVFPGKGSGAHPVGGNGGEAVRLQPGE